MPAPPPILALQLIKQNDYTRRKFVQLNELAFSFFYRNQILLIRGSPQGSQITKRPDRLMLLTLLMGRGSTSVYSCSPIPLWLQMLPSVCS